MRAYSISCLRVSRRLYSLACKSFDTFVFLPSCVPAAGVGGLFLFLGNECFCGLELLQKFYAILSVQQYRWLNHRGPLCICPVKN